MSGLSGVDFRSWAKPFAKHGLFGQSCSPCVSLLIVSIHGCRLYGARMSVLVSAKRQHQSHSCSSMVSAARRGEVEHILGDTNMRSQLTGSGSRIAVTSLCSFPRLLPVCSLSSWHAMSFSRTFGEEHRHLLIFKRMLTFRTETGRKCCSNSTNVLLCISVVFWLGWAFLV